MAQAAMMALMVAERGCEVSHSSSDRCSRCSSPPSVLAIAHVRCLARPPSARAHLTRMTTHTHIPFNVTSAASDVMHLPCDRRQLSTSGTTRACHLGSHCDLTCWVARRNMDLWTWKRDKHKQMP